MFGALLWLSTGLLTFLFRVTRTLWTAAIEIHANSCLPKLVGTRTVLDSYSCLCERSLTRVCYVLLKISRFFLLLFRFWLTYMSIFVSEALICRLACSSTFCTSYKVNLRGLSDRLNDRFHISPAGIQAGIKKSRTVRVSAKISAGITASGAAA